MFCNTCGAQISDNAAVCPKCGVPVNGGAAARGPVTESVPNHMALAILTTLFCCLIGGIVAIIYSSQVNTKLAQGDIAGAKAASKTALNWIICNAVVGVLASLLWFGICVLGALSGV